MLYIVLTVRSKLPEIASSHRRIVFSSICYPSHFDLPRRMSDSGKEGVDCPAEGGLDLSWLEESAAPPVKDKHKDGPGRKHRTGRRRTVSPSIGRHSYMSGVDWSDISTFPSIPLAGTVSKTSGDPSADMTASGQAELNTLSPLSDGGAQEGPILPEPDEVASLFIETSPPEPKQPLGLLGLRSNQGASTSQLPEKEVGSKKEVSEGGKGTAFVGDVSMALETENIEPTSGKPSTPIKPINTVPGTISIISKSPLVSTIEEATINSKKSKYEAQVDAPMNTLSGGVAVDELVPAPVRRNKSRSSRRRSILMPSEAQPFMESDIGSAEDGPSEKYISATSTAENSPLAATRAATVSGAGDEHDGKGERGGNSGTDKKKSTGSGKAGRAAKAFPLSAVNATSCLITPLAVQRGWPAGDGDTTKELVGAYHAAAKGSQRARRLAARLFCLTGFCLLPVSPEDARVLCEAAGDSLDWGLEETEKPRLVSQPPRRETREQKRELVLRIKVGVVPCRGCPDCQLLILTYDVNLTGYVKG